MLVVGVHDLAHDGGGGLDIDVETIQGESQADALPDHTKLIRLNQVTLGFLCSSISLVVGHHLHLEIVPMGSNEAPEPLCVWVQEEQEVTFHMKMQEQFEKVLKYFSKVHLQ
jgi:hypothetical protein